MNELARITAAVTANSALSLYLCRLHNNALVLAGQFHVHDADAGSVLNFVYRVLATCDGEEAVQVFRENLDDISLVILDVMMPKMNGRLACQAITSLKPDLRVLFCSGYDGESNSRESVENDRTQLLQKPFRSNELLLAVRQALETTASAGDLLSACNR